MGKNKNPFKAEINTVDVNTENVESVTDDVTEDESVTDDESVSNTLTSDEALKLVLAAEKKTKVAPQIETQVKEVGIDHGLIKLNSIKLDGLPTKEKLNANLKDDKDKALHCKKWAESNGHMFLGFSIKDGEPMFKEINE